MEIGASGKMLEAVPRKVEPSPGTGNVMIQPRKTEERIVMGSIQIPFHATLMEAGQPGQWACAMPSLESRSIPEAVTLLFQNTMGHIALEWMRRPCHAR